jgi:hypothetical protein
MECEQVARGNGIVRAPFSFIVNNDFAVGGGLLATQRCQSVLIFSRFAYSCTIASCRREAAST